MRQIGGEQSTLFSLTRLEANVLVDAIKSGKLGEAHSYRDEFVGGALVGFKTPADASRAQEALASAQ